MRWFGRYWQGRPDRDYREEMDTHIQMEERANLERGMAPGEARHAARRTFGNTLATREHLAQRRPFHFWQDLAADLRYGLRLLRRTPGLTATVVLTLALGIGANTAIFSLIDAVMLRMLPVRDPQSLVIVRATTRQGVKDWFPHTDYEWLRDHNRTFSGLAASMIFKQTLDAGDRKDRVSIEFVSGNYFSLIGVEPAAGRLIAPDDDFQNRPVAVISYAYWQRAYAGRADALGKRLRIEKADLEIIGVAARGFNSEFDFAGQYPAFWVPLSAQPTAAPPANFLHTRNISWLNLLGRLRPGVGVAQAQAAMAPLLAALRTDLHVDAQNDYLGSIGVEPGGAGLSGVRESYGEALRLLMALVAVVLLIACANVANLLLARSTARRREFAVRLAIGAGKARLLRQLLTESLLLAAMACAAGLAIGQGIVRVFVSMSEVKGLDAHTNLNILLFAAAISCAAAVAFGLAPALQSNRIDPWTTLKEGRGPGGGARFFSASRLLVIAQTALSLILLVASGLLLRTFLNLKSMSPGFDEQVLQAELDTALVSEPGVALGMRIAERLVTIQGVRGTSFSRFGPIWGSSRNCCMTPEGYTPLPNEDKNVRMQEVSPGYFDVMGIPVLAGREFAKTDREGAPQVALVNQTYANHYFPGVNPIGKRFTFSPKKPKYIEIVGLVKDVKYGSLREAPQRLVYLSALQEGRGPSIVEIRVQAGAGRPVTAIMADCRAAIREINPAIRIASFDPLKDVVSQKLTPERLVSWLSIGLGAIALLLTSVGLYGVLAYTVARRT
jgi:predicted permease